MDEIRNTYLGYRLVRGCKIGNIRTQFIGIVTTKMSTPTRHVVDEGGQGKDSVCLKRQNRTAMGTKGLRKQ